MSEEIELEFPCVPGSLEEKGAQVMEQLRQHFFYKKKEYLDGREGGRRHAALRCIHPPEIMATHEEAVEYNFTNFLKDALLDKDGNTTDPKYPTVRMIGHEQRRIRELVILNVHQFMDRIERMMPDNMADWLLGELIFNMTPFVNRYEAIIYDELTVVIPGTHQPPPSSFKLTETMVEICSRYVLKNASHGYGKAFIIDRIRDELVEYLLGGIPYNPWVLEPKTELIADEKLPKTKPLVLH